MPGGYRVYTPSSPRDRLDPVRDGGSRQRLCNCCARGNLITQTVGSFPSVSGVTSESGAGGANDYSLQLNTNFNLSTSACSGGAATCRVWQQFLYVPGTVFIQYWLIGYGAGGASCPGGYTTSGSNCYKNSSGTSAPSVAITGLANLTLTGTAASGGNDTVTFTNGERLTA